MCFKKEQVTCSNCGFLGWRIIAPDGSYKSGELKECGQYAREGVQSGEFNGEDDAIETGDIWRMACLAQQWILAPNLVKLTTRGLRYVDISNVRQKQECRYYIKYEPGFRPEEHKQLKREAETRRIIIKATLLGAAIGASAAIAAQLLYALVI